MPGMSRDGDAQHVVPAPSAALVRSCAHDSWSEALKAHAHSSESIDLPPEFVAYLLADGVHLRSDSAALPTRTAADPYEETAFNAEDERSDSGEDAAVPHFPELEAAIDAAIARLGGSVLPKLNWSAPKDAVWLTVGGSLRCRNAAEVLLLLKASDAVTHDLCHAYEACADVAVPADAPPTAPQLVLKKWYDLKPSMEFRCFVRGGRLVGVSQRHTGEHYPFLSEQRASLAAQLDEFHEAHVAPAFPHPDYTYDVYVTSAGTVRVLDFNPWGGATLPLLFTWHELARIDEEEGEGDEPCPAVRVVDSPQGIRPGLRTGVPLELYDTSAGSALSELIARHRDDAVPGGGV